MIIEIADGEPYPDDVLLDALTRHGATLAETNGGSGGRKLLAYLPDDENLQDRCRAMIVDFWTGEP